MIKTDRQKKKTLLIILDGFGEAKKSKGNAIKLANTPFMNSFTKYPKTFLKSNGESVGVPKEYPGGSEVGHFTIGAGRVTKQALTEINYSIKNKSFFKNQALLSAIKNCKKHNSSLHLIGMISDKGVHSHLNHLFNLIKLAKTNKIKSIYIHCFTDGRDVPEKSATKFIKKIQKEIKSQKIGEIASIIGRFYSMDRDTNWNRTEKAYNLLTKLEGIYEKDPISAIKNAYKRGDQTDYYLKPMILNKSGNVKNNDSIIFFNYRTDRSKQLTSSFTDINFPHFKRENIKTHFVCMGPYSKTNPIAFKEPKIKNNLGEIFAKKKIKQLRISETEKYAHVTFFFNSQKKEPYFLEDRLLIPSPKVPSYAQKPEMSSNKLTNKLIKEIKLKKYDFILVNYPNADLVGHSGDLKATIKCIEILDQCLKKLIPNALKQEYSILVTADHGNAEKMKYPNGEDCPAHSTNKVPCWLIEKEETPFKKLKKRGMSLQNIAPTILELMQIKKPKEMTGESLIKN